ncbi:DUF3883 domain-containing protein [Bacillus toyonensis]|uniref:DUF3883 domain-containing protein n=1 Tax=Bacillus toyonensis TaxID=155322 RepID=UPI0036E64EC5
MVQFEKMMKALQIIEATRASNLSMRLPVIETQLLIQQLDPSILQELLAYQLIELTANQEVIFSNEASMLLGSRNLVFAKQLKLFAQPLMRRFEKEIYEVFCLMLKYDFILQELEIPKVYRPMIELLLDVGILHYEHENVVLDPKLPCFIKWLEGHAFSDEDFNKLKEIQKKLGDLAEKIAYEFEVERLKKLGMCEEATRCELISKTHLSAGFDMKSFTSPSPVPNRFIEIKTFDNEHFYLSRTERKKAEVLKDAYFLYLVNTQTGEIQMIQNPILNMDDCFYQEVMDIHYTLKSTLLP